MKIALEEARQLYEQDGMTKDELIQVFEDTMASAMEEEYKDTKGNVHTLVPPLRTFIYHDEIHINHDTVPSHDTIIEVKNQDCLYAAYDMYKQYNCVPCVLNMASYVKPGGGVLKGSRAQEESLFRRTNLCASLYCFSSYGKHLGFELLENAYPIEGIYDAIYTNGVTVFKDAESNGCQLLSEPYMINVVSVAAIKNPKLNQDGSLMELPYKHTYEKIRTILNVAIENGQEYLVLSAFGCGAYHNPPSDIAAIFCDILSQEPYNHAFKHIVFAVIDDHNAKKTGNFAPFKQIFN